MGCWVGVPSGQGAAYGLLGWCPAGTGSGLWATGLVSCGHTASWRELSLVAGGVCRPDRHEQPVAVSAWSLTAEYSRSTDMPKQPK